MTYQETVDLFRSVAEVANPKGGFLNGSRNDGSVHSVSTGAEGVTPKQPLIHLYSLRKTVDRNTDSLKWNVVLAFWGQDDLKNVPTQTDQERERIQAEMEVLCEAFMTELYDRPVMIEGEQQTPEVMQLGGGMTGWSVVFYLVGKIGC